MSSLRPVLLLVLALLPCGCATRPADLDALLERTPVAPRSTLEGAGGAQELHGRWSERSADLLAASREDPGDADLALECSRALFRAADARMLAASLAWLEDHPRASIERTIDVEGELDEELRSEVLALVLEGRARAELSLELAPERVDARLHAALHLSLEAWARGPVGAMMEGLGKRVPRAIRAVLEEDETLESAAPLRLMGRFLDRAPWPVGDRTAAIEHLERAWRIAPTVLNGLYLGDALWSAGREDAARGAWQAALAGEDGVGTGETAPLHRELLRRRLAATLGE